MATRASRTSALRRIRHNYLLLLVLAVLPVAAPFTIGARSSLSNRNIVRPEMQLSRGACTYLSMSAVPLFKTPWFHATSKSLKSLASSKSAGRPSKFSSFLSWKSGFGDGGGAFRRKVQGAGIVLENDMFVRNDPMGPPVSTDDSDDKVWTALQILEQDSKFL